MLPLFGFSVPYSLCNQTRSDDKDTPHIESMDCALRHCFGGDRLACPHIRP